VGRYLRGGSAEFWAVHFAQLGAIIRGQLVVQDGELHNVPVGYDRGDASRDVGICKRSGLR